MATDIFVVVRNLKGANFVLTLEFLKGNILSHRRCPHVARSRGEKVEDRFLLAMQKEVFEYDAGEITIFPGSIITGEVPIIDVGVQVFTHLVDADRLVWPQLRSRMTTSPRINPPEWHPAEMLLQNAKKMRMLESHVKAIRRAFRLVGVQFS